MANGTALRHAAEVAATVRVFRSATSAHRALDGSGQHRFQPPRRRLRAQPPPSSPPALLELGGHRAVLCGHPGDGSVPPLVLIGGTAQWLDSWAGHLPAFARGRQCLAYEPRGQAGGARALAGMPDLDLTDCSLAAHASDFWEVLDAAEAAGLVLGHEPPPPASTSSMASLRERGSVDVLGFSFGARVAMAAAATPNRPRASNRPAIRKLCLTGVAGDRGPSGRLALASWRASLAASDLRGFAWSLILDTHSPAYLAANEARVAGWVDAVVRANSAAGLKAIVDQTHTEDRTDSSHPLHLAATIRRLESVASGMLLVGDSDALSPVSAARLLADEAGWPLKVIGPAGHALPIEQPTRWRRAALAFIDDL